MKKIFQKISKMVFIAGIIAIIDLVLILAYGVEAADSSLDGVWGLLALICVGIAFVTIVFSFINFVLAFIDEMKRNKKDFLKRFVVQFFVMFFIYIFLHFTSDIEKNLNMLEISMRSFFISIGIFGGQYMIAPPKEEDELHF